MGLINFFRNIFSNKENSTISISYSNPKSSSKDSLSKNIGVTEALCPYCNSDLEKKPTRKTKCPHCNNYIYKRTRPYDNADILIREEQIDLIEEEWSIVNDSHDIYLKEKERERRIRDEMRKRFGREIFKVSQICLTKF
jgi:hypothetical protein